MIEDYFTQTGEIQRSIKTPDGAGGHKIEWITIMTSLGKLDGISGGAGFYAQKAHADSTHVWICGVFELTMEDPADQILFFGAPFFVAPAASLIPTNVQAGDRLLINTPTLGAVDLPYRITFLDDPMNFKRHLEIELKRWENDG